MVSGGPVELDLGPIESRLEAATPGPWVVEYEYLSRVFYGAPNGMCDVYGSDRQSVAIGGLHEDGGPHVGAMTPEDADFIAHARQDVPVLLAEVRRLRGQVQRVRDWGETLWDGEGTEPKLYVELFAALDAEAVTE